MLVFCPRCGAEYPELAGTYTATSSQCRDCGLAVTDEPAMLEPDDDQVAFVLEDWPVEFRGEATAILTDNQIPHRWEAGFALVVPAAVEERVDVLLDEAEAAAEGDLGGRDDYDDDHEYEDDAEYEDDNEYDEDDEDEYDEDEGGGSDDEGGALEGEVLDGGAGDDTAGGEDDEDADGGEEAAEAMSDLYLVSDRLQHQPWDTELRSEITTLATQVNALLPPYGVERRMWNRIGDLAAVVAADIERDAEDDEIVTSTVALRQVVRDFV